MRFSAADYVGAMIDACEHRTWAAAHAPVVCAGILLHTGLRTIYFDDRDEFPEVKQFMQDMAELYVTRYAR